MSRGSGERPGPPDINGLHSLKIDNISFRMTGDDLRRIFDRFGEIGDIHIPRDRYTKQSKGFGFVRFYSKRDADYALEKTDGKWEDGREMRVAFAHYKRPFDASRGGGGGGGGYGDRGGGGGRGGGRRYSSRSRSRSRSRSPRRRRSSRDRSRSRSGSPKEEKGRPSRSLSRSPDRARGSKSASRSP